MAMLTSFHAYTNPGDLAYISAGITTAPFACQPVNVIFTREVDKALRCFRFACLSAQATDVGVNKATRALFREVETPEQMLSLGEDGLKEHIL